MWDCLDSQEVGLEAATLERVRNSSLVEWSCADNVTGLKQKAEAASFRVSGMGRGASISAVKRPRKRLWSVVECECRHE
jgi:hypothetical protein